MSTGFPGLLKCSICGGSLGYNRSNDQKKRPDFFQCWKYAKGMHPGSCCLAVHLAEKAVIESLEEVLKQMNWNMNTSKNR